MNDLEIIEYRKSKGYSTKEEVYETILHNWEIKRHDENLLDKVSEEDGKNLIDNIKLVRRINSKLFNLLTNEERVEFKNYE